MRAPSLTDHPIAALAARQHGVVTRRQLADQGLDRGRIARRVSAGRLHRIHLGVYAVGHLAPHRETRWMAAVLACGDGAVLSYRTAAVLWGLLPADGAEPHVTAPGQRAHRGIVTHRGALSRRDRAVVNGIPSTSVARTLADLAHALPERATQRLKREAEYRGLLQRDALADALTRRPSAVLTRLSRDRAATQSDLEDRFLNLMRRHRIPRPATQRVLGANRVDFHWPQQRLVVEVDGWRGHGTRSAFQADRTATNALQLSGQLVLRCTDNDVDLRGAFVANQVRAGLRPHA